MFSCTRVAVAGVPWATGICKMAQEGDIEEDDGNSCDGQNGAGVAPLLEREASQPQRVDGGDDEGEPIGSGEGSKPRQQWIVDLGDAEQVPGKAGDSCAG